MPFLCTYTRKKTLQHDGKMIESYGLGSGSPPDNRRALRGANSDGGPGERLCLRESPLPAQIGTRNRRSAFCRGCVRRVPFPRSPPVRRGRATAPPSRLRGHVRNHMAREGPNRESPREGNASPGNKDRPGQLVQYRRPFVLCTSQGS